MNRLRKFAIVLGCFISGTSLADDADDLYKSVYEPKVKAAMATADRKDDVILAMEFLVAARQQTDLPRLAILLADKAYEMTARDPAGLAVAGDALTLLIDIDKKGKADLLDKLIDIRQRQFTASRADGKVAAADALIDSLLVSAKVRVDAKEFAAAIPLYRRALSAAILGKSERQAELKASLDSLQRQQKSMDQINLLREKLLENANDFGAIDELVRLYIIDFDDANEALGYANRSKDPALKEFAALAAKDSTELTPDQNLKLGDWYRTLASSVADERKPTPLLRAKECYAAAMESPVATDFNKRKAELLAKEVDASLGKIAASSQPLPAREPKAEAVQWTEMTPLIDLSKDVGKGNWVIKKNSLTLLSQSPDNGNSYFNFPVTAKGSYEWQIKLETFSETEGFRFVFPVGDRRATMVIAGNTFIEYAVDPDPAKPTSKSSFRFSQGKTHQMQIIVKPNGDTATILLVVDRKTQLQWTGDATKLPGGNGFALVPWNHKAAYHDMKVRPLPGGEIKLLREVKP